VSRLRTSSIGNPDRRLAPRPLPAHLTAAMMLWLSSRAALPCLKNVSSPSSAVGKRLCALAAEIDACGRDNVTEALDREIADRAASYLAGLETYRRHPFRRRRALPPVLWREGTTRLLDYGCGTAGPVVLVVPSLINRYYVLDLLPERSFLRHFARSGLRPVVVDWGAPGKDERDFDLTDYVVERLDAAFTAALQVAGGPIGVIGYCMGGLLALALALRRQDQVGCLALLATPWDFHAERATQVQMLARAAECLAGVRGPRVNVPVDVIQSLFFLLDPFTAERKFAHFAALDPEGEEARVFVALEDWLNDGVPLAGRVARDCARFWYGENRPGRGCWRIGGQKVDPKLLRRPTLVVVPGRDRIVPPRSAEPLAAALGAATVLRPPLGHVGMMAAARAPVMLWTPIAEWLRECIS
jgi:polyhydroxyalkanoate synthase subunit PhaC